MRLQRLEIQGFGGLQDLSVEFHPSFTVLLGPNESGKSTLHRAVRAALYGLDGGGQGRPVDRSDWARWTPWSGGAYGVALTYALAEGRTVRVARRLESREQTVQVLEIGGSDLTDELRRGRQVVPGLFHLGIDEAVFSATAWLGDDGLRLGAADAAPQRAQQLQEAIERLADTRRGTTAAAAVARLRAALAELGTERRATSPLGSATLRLRELDRSVAEVSRRLEVVALQRDRLHSLEAAASSAQRERDAAEWAWLQAKLHGLQQRRSLIRAAVAERLAAEQALTESTPYISVPVDLEARVGIIAGELRQAEQTAADVTSRTAAAAPVLAAATSRLAEVDAGLEVVGRTGFFDPTLAARAGVATADVERLSASASQQAATSGSDARVLALRQEIARTGLGAMPVGSADALAALVRTARGGQLRFVVAGVLALALGAAGGVVAWQRQAMAIGAAAVAAGTAAAVLLLITALVRHRRSAVAAEDLADLEERLGLEAADLEQVRDRVPALQALHAALLHEEAAAAGRQAEADALSSAAGAALARCQSLAAEACVVVAPTPMGTTAAVVERCRLLLQRVDEAVVLQRRHDELSAERLRLEGELSSLAASRDDAQRSVATVQRLRARLEQTLASAGLPPLADPEQAVAAAATACAQRRRHEEALRLLAGIGQRLAALGDDESLARAAAQFEEELAARAGAAVVADELPPDDTLLTRLEHQARRSAQASHVAATEARELRARLEGVVETLPNLADLEDERNAAAAERQHLLRQQAALLRAVNLLEAAAKSTHRDLAPRLAEWVATHLDALTESRYRSVNVDTDHFAISLLCRDRPDMVPLEAVSHGTRDQVALLLRLALCETLSDSSEPAPLLLDEPLLTADPARRATLIQFLHNMAATHQVVLSTADPSVAEAVRGCCGDLCAVVEVGVAPGASHGQGHVRIAG